MFFINPLKPICKLILESSTVDSECAAADELNLYFKNYFTLSSTGNDFNKELMTKGGIAISMKEAAFCVEDRLRTIRFIKGIYTAIQELIIRFPNDNINILYAGCGPFATLITPLLPYLSPHKISITLLEINPISVEFIQQWMGSPDLKDYNISIINADATTYRFPDDQPLHLVITETMFNGLVREPQLAVTANLATQLHKYGILIPESINLSLAYSSFGNEPYLKHDLPIYNNIESESAGQKKYGITIDELFKLNKDNNFSESITNPTEVFVSKWYEAPESFTDYPDVCIYTDITIFKEQRLGLASSYITNPICVHSLYNLFPKQYFRLVYSITNEPIWHIEKKGSC
ncbi:MAG: class I SAM-dependent methyltransferase [Bacteroidia bacterium]|jgi:hypothetical protein|nr:class I SAM-dependent methyltransferase [Bacteroidia bacterium]